MQLTVPVTHSGDYTLQASDAFALIQMNSAIVHDLNIPLDSSVNFLVGTQIDVIATGGAGLTTIQAATPGTDPTGTVVLSKGTTPSEPAIKYQYGQATLFKFAANSWYVTGDIQ